MVDNLQLEHLRSEERSCVQKFLALLTERLGDTLSEVRLFGSAARGDMWAEDFPIHSDIDLLVLTREPLTEAVQQALLDETYPLYLECGRQLSPQWRTVGLWETPPDDRARQIKERIDSEGKILFQKAKSG